jgi:hypothetical protein
MIQDNDILSIFCAFDDFFKNFDHLLKSNAISALDTKRRNKPSSLSTSEVMTIIVLFHCSGYRCLKHFYLYHVCTHLKHLFPKTVSYNRFVELQKQAAFPLAMFTKMFRMGRCSGISFIDSTPLKVCHNAGIHSNKVFQGIATRGRSSTGWFYGFKLHLIHNDRGEIVDFQLTPANIHDNNLLKCKRFLRKIYGKLFGDKGYIVNKSIFDELFLNDIHLVTKLRRNMKSTLLTPLEDAIMLRRRAISETIIDQLKNISQIEHTRHRSFVNFFTNVLGGMLAYQFKDKIPSIYEDCIDTKQLFLA